MRNKRRQRGFAHERDLVLKLWNKGFAVLRAPASGAKTRRTAVPDVVAIKSGVVYCFEVKTTRKARTIYIPKHQVDKLREFVKRAGGKGFVAVKIIGESGWRFIPVEMLEETGGGNYKVTAETMARGYRLKDLVAMASGNKSLDEYVASSSDPDISVSEVQE